MKVLNERFPYRYVECGTLDNGFPDFRIQRNIETVTQRNIGHVIFSTTKCSIRSLAYKNKEDQLGGF